MPPGPLVGAKRNADGLPIIPGANGGSSGGGQRIPLRDLPIPGGAQQGQGGVTGPPDAKRVKR
jgi:hypothetical protein